MKTSLIALGCALAAASPVMAQNADALADQSSGWTPQIVVTGIRDGYAEPAAVSGTRTATPVEKVPQSVQSLTRQLIEDQDLQNLTDALVNVSGVAPTSQAQAVLQPTLGARLQGQLFHRRHPDISVARRRGRSRHAGFRRSDRSGQGSERRRCLAAVRARHFPASSTSSRAIPPRPSSPPMSACALAASTPGAAMPISTCRWARAWHFRISGMVRERQTALSIMS